MDERRRATSTPPIYNHHPPALGRSTVEPPFIPALFGPLEHHQYIPCAPRIPQVPLPTPLTVTHATPAIGLPTPLPPVGRVSGSSQRTPPPPYPYWNRNRSRTENQGYWNQQATVNLERTQSPTPSSEPEEYIPAIATITVSSQRDEPGTVTVHVVSRNGSRPPDINIVVSPRATTSSRGGNLRSSSSHRNQSNCRSQSRGGGP